MKPDLRLGRWEDALADVPDASVRLVLTSPPYDNARDYADGTPSGPVDFAALAVWALRVLVPGGVFAMVLDGAVNDGILSATPFVVIADWSVLPGWRLSQVLAYARHGAPGEYRGRFRRDHEPLIVFVRDGGDVVCEKARLSVGRTGRAGMARERDGSRRKPTGLRDEYDVLPGSIWWYGAVGADPSCGLGHPATFAEKFALDAVRVWSNPGDVVCDPFSGSGTVGRACVDLGRRFVGAEAAPEYHAIAMRRLAQTALLTEAAS